MLICLCLLPSCRRAKIISTRDMSDIYAEMFLADQWLNSNNDVRKTADTTRFYETIFRKYGHDFDDYDASVNYYLNRPEKYRKILERAQQKLRATQKSLEEFQAKVDKQNKILEGLGYLHLPVFAADSVKVDTSMAPAQDAKGYNIFMYDDEVTGIDDVEVRVVIEGIYDLNGRKLDIAPEDLPKGVYIVNGKKQMMK